MASRIGLASDEMSSIFARQNGCVKCLDTSPTCPTCDNDEVCLFTVGSCTECPKAYCAASPTSSTTTSSNQPSVGAIAGGVIGGVAAIGIITYLVWRFCIKNKRDKFEKEPWQEEVEPKEGLENDFASRRSARQSTHSVHSLASTVLTRASNIIQIAYIPGVTNRATPTSPTLLVPPVPPIPMTLSDAGSPSPYEEQHFFVPGDLRDSTYSGISGYSDRTSYARTSYAPRSSVASTIYGKNAVVSPLPAQKGNFLKPSIVSVKSRAPSSGSEGTTPPVPAVDYDKYDQPPPSPAFSIGSTFFKNASASTATAVRPQVVSVKTVSTKGSSPSDSSGEEPDTPGPLVDVRESQAPQGPQSPFSDPPVKSPSHGHSSLSAVIKEATRRASKTNFTSSERNHSPFGDEHAVRE